MSNQPISASSSRVQTSPSSPSASSDNRPAPEVALAAAVALTTAAAKANNNDDDFELIECKVNRADNRPLGLSLATNSQANMPIIKSVEQGSPAEAAGLRAGDLIVEINGKPTSGQTNSSVGQIILNSPSPIQFVVSRKITGLSPHISRRDAHNQSNHSMEITDTRITMSSSRLQQPVVEEIRVRNSSAPGDPSLMSSNSAAALSSQNSINRRSLSSFTLPRDAPIPRLCRLRALEESMGFTVSGSSAKRGEFRVNEVAPNSPAAHSGLQNDDYLIEICGENVDSMSYEEVVSKIKMKKIDDDLQLLVADRATIDWYKARSIPMSSALVPKLKYIETLYNEEILAASTDNGKP